MAVEWFCEVFYYRSWETEFLEGVTKHHLPLQQLSFHVGVCACVSSPSPFFEKKLTVELGRT